MTAPALPPTGPDALREQVAALLEIAAHATAYCWEVPGVPRTRMWAHPVPGGWAVMRTGGLTADWWTGTGWHPAATVAVAARMALPEAVAVAQHLAAVETAQHAAWTRRPYTGPDEHLTEYAQTGAAA